MIRVETVTSYAHLASALINNDYSGIEDDPDAMKDLQRVHNYIGEGSIVACEEESYFGSPDHYGLRGDVVDYTVHYQDN